MDILTFLKRDRRESYLTRVKVLEREIDLLVREIELLKLNGEPTVRTALFESAVIRASKVLRNSGFTMRSLREYVRQSCLKPFRRELYALLDEFHREEELLFESITRLKNCRDRMLVHLDPRFAFHPERFAENSVELEDLELVCDHLVRHINLFKS